MKGGSRNPFQSTLPARGATTFDISAAAGELISIHAPCTGSDAIAECTCAQCGAFQSTLPARGATGVVHQALKPQKAISIHAPCTGSDLSHFALYNSLSNFNPRSLHGERRLHAKALFCPTAFQSTLPARGATFRCLRCCLSLCISIHAPCTGSDSFFSQNATSRSLFQSTLPARGATLTARRTRSSTAFQSTLPARGATVASFLQVKRSAISIHAPCTGSDRAEDA